MIATHCPTRRIILAEFPATHYTRLQAGRLAWKIRNDHILERHEIVCSEVIKADGERVFRVFVYPA